MFSLSMKTSGSAFCEPETGNEDENFEWMMTISILKEIEQQIEHGKRSGAIMDVNGNKVGTWKFS